MSFSARRRDGAISILQVQGHLSAALANTLAVICSRVNVKKRVNTKERIVSTGHCGGLGRTHCIEENTLCDIVD